MKAFHILAAGFALCAAFASCEMKDELKGINDGTNGDTGYLELGVAVNGSQNTVTTKAEVDEDGTQAGTSVSADDFPVVITGVTDASYKKEFVSYAALKAEGAIELPVGTYTIAAHSNKELEEEMTEPYYDGAVDINITKGANSKAEVVCKMKNTKISMNYSSEFTSRFQSWTITVTDERAILEFVCTNKTSEELNPAPLYMLVQEGVSELTVRVTAVNLKGETVRESRTLTKPAGGNSSAWTGGDALTITMSGYDPELDVETGIQGSGIQINADVEFDESEDVVEVPVTPGSEEDDNTDPVEPGTGDDEEEEEPVQGEAPTLTGEYLTKTLYFDQASGETLPVLTIDMTIPNGIADIIVTADTDNEEFKGMLADPEMGLTEGASLLTSETLAELFELPKINDTSYTFTLDERLGGLLQVFTGNHKFIVKVIDQKNLSVEGTLNISITNSAL